LAIPALWGPGLKKPWTAFVESSNGVLVIGSYLSGDEFGKPNIFPGSTARLGKRLVLNAIKKIDEQNQHCRELLGQVAKDGRDADIQEAARKALEEKPDSLDERSR